MYKHTQQIRLAIDATTHCLIGCGLGEVLGVIIGTFFGVPYISRIFFGIVFGFILGFLFGIIPLWRTPMTFFKATKIVLTTELFSIIAMECAEAVTELLFPGMRRLGLLHIQYWLGLFCALIVGFLAAFPVNLFLLKKGVRHRH